MALRFILGRSGTGKTRYCINSIIEDLRAGRQGPSLILLVPEQATYQAERSLLTDPRIEGFSRLRVLSFNRLCFHLLGQSPGKQELTRVGQEMLVRKVLMQCRNKLRVLGVDMPGLARVLVPVLKECRYQMCGTQDLRAAVDRLMSEGQTVSAHKLHDIQIVLEAYTEILAHAQGLSDPDMDLNRAQTAVAETGWLHGTRLWVDGFAGFTVQELALLMELIRCASDTNVALCLDPEGFDLACRNPQDLDPDSLFSETERTYVDLCGVCVRIGAPVDPPLCLNKVRRFEDQPVLAHLEDALSQSETETYAGSVQDVIDILGAPNPRTEVQEVSDRISQYVRQGRCRYRDIAVVVPDMTAYQPLLESAFKDAGIPYFLDLPQTLQHHPVVTLIIAALHAVLNGFHTEDVLAFLKTNLGPLRREETDLLENYCLGAGMTGTYWTSQRPWSFAGGLESGFDDRAVDILRQRAVSPLIRLSHRLTCDPLICPRDFLFAVQCLLDDLHVSGTLEREWEPAAQAPFMHRQVLDRLLGFLDECAAVLPEEPVDVAFMKTVVCRGIEQLTLKQIPPALDQVLVGTIERSRHPDIRFVFLIGVTQKQFPVPVVFDTVLTDADRTAAIQAGLPLHPPVPSELPKRQYLAYIALTRASDYVCVSYPLTDISGSALEPAPVVDTLLGLFPGLCIEKVQTEAERPWEAVTPLRLLDVLCTQLSETGPRERIRRVAHIAGTLARHTEPSVRDIGLCVQRCLHYDNKAYMSPDLAHRIHGRELSCAATHLEHFAACPYRYFARYVLRLKPRRRLRFEALEAGDLYHRVLNHLFQSLHKRDRSLRDLSRDEIQDETIKAFTDVVAADDSLGRYMDQGRQRRYEVQCLGRTLCECTADLAAMMQAGDFRQSAAEFAFGLETGPRAVTLEASDHRVIRLTGRIDRVDLLQTEDGQYAAVLFDYKRGRTSTMFRLNRWFYGLSLQTPLYALALQGMEVSGRPVHRCVGAFLVPIEVPLESRTFQERGASAFLRKARGLFDGDFALLLDRDPGRYGSRFYAFYLKENSPYGRLEESAAYTPEEYKCLLRYTHHQIVSLAQRIQKGEIEIYPYRLATETPCDFCDYRSVCKFDWQINTYRPLARLGRSQILACLGEDHG